jgi:ABC-2 type transport system permease protein
MGVWRLELLRIWRTRRIVALGAIFVILGLGEPILTYYLPELVKGSGHGVQITVPKQTATDAMAAFAGDVGQLGTLVVVVVAAASLAIDANPSLAAFYRSRIHRPARLLVPRYATVTAASVAMLALGTISAVYETAVLFGAVPIGALVGGFALEAVWICFATSIVAVFASLVRGLAGVVGGSIALLLALGLLGSASSVSSWLPTRLAGSGAALLQHPFGDLWHAVIVSSIATFAALAFAVNRLGDRELYPAGLRRAKARR